MIFLEKQHNLNEKEEDLIKFILSANFPFFYQKYTKNFFGFSHILMRRTFKDNSIREDGMVVSNHYDTIIEIFKRFCLENNISVNNIYRAAINLSTYDAAKHGNPHTDHNYPHKVFLMYLNDFSNGNTYLFNNDDAITHIILAKKNKVVVFDGLIRHAQGFCNTSERRLTFVVTFS